MCGWNPDNNFSLDRLPVIAAHQPGGTSVMVMAHWYKRALICRSVSLSGLPQLLAIMYVPPKGLRQYEMAHSASMTTGHPKRTWRSTGRNIPRPTIWAAFKAHG